MERIILIVLLILGLVVSNGYCALNQWGETDTNALLKKVIPGYLQAAGTAIGDATSMSTADIAVPVSYCFVRKQIPTSAGFITGTLPNGTKGQLLTIMITAIGSGGTWTLTPTTCTGFTSVLFDTAKDTATFLYVDDTIGWIVIANTGVTINTAY